MWIESKETIDAHEDIIKIETYVYIYIHIKSKPEKEIISSIDQSRSSRDKLRVNYILNLGKQNSTNIRIK